MDIWGICWTLRKKLLPNPNSQRYSILLLDWWGCVGLGLAWCGSGWGRVVGCRMDGVVWIGGGYLAYLRLAFGAERSNGKGTGCFRHLLHRCLVIAGTQGRGQVEQGGR